jgi:DNA-directed RNA polymerase II subunit RPB2
LVLDHISKLPGWVPLDAAAPDQQWSRLVFLNGAVVGTCADTRAFKQQCDAMRVLHQTMRDVGVIRVKSEDSIFIEADEGRFIRPLFAIGPRNVVLFKQPENIGLTWDEYVRRGVIVFRDVWELEQSVVALSEDDLLKNRCDYLEICPAATMMGVMASAIPLSNHCQSPRNAYQASMGKQAIGLPSTAWLARYDTTLHILNTPQKPITKSGLVSVLKFDEMSHGAVPVVAIMTFSGFNQEDSIILNKASIDRGLFTTTTYKTIVEEETKKGKTEIECVCLPKVQYRNRNYDYTYLNDQGVVWKPNIWLKKGTVVIGKTTKKMIKNAAGVRKPEITDTSIVIKHGEEGYLDKVLITANTEGTKIIKVRIRLLRIPEIGDKFASSTAQKGTCGMIFPQCDLPFDKHGITPDLIINPHAMPSRMTINMLIEMFFNRVGCELGREMDATPFRHRNIEEELSFWAQKANIDLRSEELMDGRTGERTRAAIFMAPCFYQRLKHLVSDKIHARMTGPLDTLTHQPVAGRAKNGALRFGEMEKDALLVHGSTRALKENLFDKSDAFQVPVCVKCGNIPNLRHTCDLCGDAFIETKNLPYATKLLLQELAGMGINAIIR